MLQYRKDIDGFRTIAVLLVILNHAGFTFFSGGFVGVDVFFVISGFLITAIIAPKIADKTFSFAWFLSRRIKRLMPVLLFIVFVTAAVFTAFMLPQDLMRFYRSIIWVVLYGANIFFWREHGGYFDGGSQEAPLLHTWSLAVEEQYYLLWPLLLLAMIRLFGLKITVWLSIVICVVATVFSQWGTQVTIGAAYYLLPTRFFELLVGSCLALAWNHLPKPKILVAHVCSIVGIVLIVGSAILLNKYHSFPGYNALYPVLGTALLIYSQGGIVNQLFSLKPFVFTGNISYSLYLWHWPVFVVFHYTALEFNLSMQLLSIAVVYVLSVLSYYYIEQPCRTAKISSFKPVALTMYAIPSSALIAFALIGIQQQGFSNRFDSTVVMQEQAVNSFANESRPLCHASLRNSADLPNESCTFGDKTTPPKLFVFGDSHANHIVPFLDVLTKDANMTGQDYTLDRCLPITNVSWGSNQFKANQCIARNNQALEHIKAQNFDYVVIAASWPEIATKRIVGATDNSEKRRILLSNLVSMLTEITNTGAIPVMIADTPVLQGKSPKCVIKKQLYNDALNCDISPNKNQLFAELAQVAKRQFKQLLVIEPQQVMCNNGNCKIELNNIPLYRDEDHLNEVGASTMALEYIALFGNPLSQPTGQ